MVFLSYDGFAYIRENGGVPSGILNTQGLDSYVDLYIHVDALLEFGYQEQEISDMIFFIMGDDNLFYGKGEYERIQRFFLFFVQYAQQRHGMKLSITKSLISNLRHKITVLSYDNDYGEPLRNVGKLVAQLALPERPIKEDEDYLHAIRALGLATADCGKHHDFYRLCQMVYHRFIVLSPVPISKVLRVLPYMALEALELESYVLGDTFTFPHFPEFEEIRRKVSSYQGSFNERDHWPKEIFSQPPSDPMPNKVTLSDVLATNPEIIRPVETFL